MTLALPQTHTVTGTAPPTAGSIEISGGAGGVMADVESLRAFSCTVHDLARGLAAGAAQMAALGSTSALVLTGALDPAGSARVYAQMGAVTARLTAGAGTGLAYARAVGLAAEGYRLADAEVSDVVHAIWQVLGPSVAAPVFALAVGSAAGWTAGRVAGEMVDEVPVAASRLAGGADHAQVWRDATDNVRADSAEVLADDGQSLLDWLVRHPDVFREALATLPLLVPSELIPDDPQGVAPGTGGVGMDGQGGQVAGFTTLVLAAGRSAGYFVDGRVDVTRVERHTRRGPAGVSDLLRRSSKLTGPRGALNGYTELKGGTVVDTLPPGADGRRRHVVYLAPTNDWGAKGGPYASDLTSNLSLVAKQGMRPGAADPDAVEGAVKAMRRAGIQRDDSVLLVGFSQGGITAATVASDPELRRQFSVEGMLTAGAPISEFVVPGEVQVLSLENDSDLIAELDASQNPDRPNWTTVTQPDLDPRRGSPVLAERAAAGESFAGHYLDGYAELGAVVDASDHPSAVAWRDSMAGFLAPEQEVTTTEVTVRRTS